MCPSFDALAPITQLFKASNVYVGAQNCAAHQKGAYTGEICPQSIRECGAHYCIVGHSERRQHFGETNEVVAQKMELLLQNNVIPIVCIGETGQEYTDKKTYNILQKQLLAIFNSAKNKKIYIAYEPLWAIGTGIAAKSDYLQNIFTWLQTYCSKVLCSDGYKLLYGGSVNDNNAQDLKKITCLDGFLIGGASLDFQKFQNIVVS